MNSLAMQTLFRLPRMNEFLTAPQCRTLLELPGRSLWHELSQPLVVAAPGGTLLYANKAFSDLVGYPREWIVGDRPPYQFGPGYDVVKGSLLFNAGPLPRQISQSSCVKEFDLRHADGSLFPVRISLASYGHQGSVLANIALVTPLWGAESLIQSAQQARLQQPRLDETQQPADSHLAGFSSLTKRQRQIVDLSVKGYTAKDIAVELNSSVSTIRNHRKGIYFKLSVGSTMALMMKYARHKGLKPSTQKLTGYDHLSPRERQVVQVLLEGNEPQTVAEKLHMSVYTVRNHLKRIYEKLDVLHYQEIVAIALGLR